MRKLSSRQSLDAATSMLLNAAAVLDDAAVGALGQDLNAVGGLLSGQPALRRTLADGSSDPDSRATLAGSLLAGKIGATAVKLVQDVVRLNWAGSQDLVDALYRLSRTAEFSRAERSGELDRIEEELFRFARILDASPELAEVLDAPSTPAADRIAVLDRLLASKVSGSTMELLHGLAADPRGRSFVHGVDELVEQSAQRRDRVVAFITSPVALSAEQHNRAVAALTRIYGRPVTAHVEVDPALLGGLTIRVGDEVIDGSVSGRLTELRTRLAG